ncbi:MAG: class I SAM-dependent methyltransferase [Ectobacillus sp.]
MPVYLHITGIDLSKEMLVQAKKRAQHRDVALLQMNAEELQFPDGVYDVVILNLILSVVERPAAALSEALREK